MRIDYTLEYSLSARHVELSFYATKKILHTGFNKELLRARLSIQRATFSQSSFNILRPPYFWIFLSFKHIVRVRCSYVAGRKRSNQLNLLSPPTTKEFVFSFLLRHSEILYTRNLF